MLKREIKFTNFNDEEVVETHYFNLSKSDIVEMQYGADGADFGETLQRIIKTEDKGGLIREFKKLILDAYGQKSADGNSFLKSPELSRAFSQTLAYDALFMELATNEEAAAQFVNGVFPAGVIDQDKPVGPPPTPQTAMAPLAPPAS